MQNANGNHPWLIEIYPAATLSKLGLYRSGYKNHPESANRRTQNIVELQNQGTDIPNRFLHNFRESDDAHDSLVAAIGAYHALQNGFPRDNPEADVEGQIFA